MSTSSLTCAMLTASLAPIGNEPTAQRLFYYIVGHLFLAQYVRHHENLCIETCFDVGVVTASALDGARSTQSFRAKRHAQAFQNFLKSSTFLGGFIIFDTDSRRNNYRACRFSNLKTPSHPNKMSAWTLILKAAYHSQAYSFTYKKQSCPQLTSFDSLYSAADNESSHTPRSLSFSMVWRSSS